MASLYVKDSEANDLAGELAERRGISKTAAVKLALRNELDREPAVAAAPVSLRDRLEYFWREHEIACGENLAPDKAFYDRLWERQD